MVRRSLPRLMISDNGMYFKSTAKYLMEIVREPSVQDFLGDHSMEWRFVSPRAPWQGGFYERLIGIVKGRLHCGKCCSSVESVPCNLKPHWLRLKR